MKLFHKIIAMVSALAVVSSMAVSSVSALTAAEATFTTSFTNAEGVEITDATTLKAGDTVLVTVSTKDFINVAGVGFKLNFDGEYLTAADGEAGSGRNKYPACLDKDWYLDYVKDGLGVIGIIGEPTPGVTDSSVTLGWASDAAVTEGDIVDWECEDLTTVAKIVLTVDKDVDKALDFTYTNGYYFIDGNVSVPVVTATIPVAEEEEPEVITNATVTSKDAVRDGYKTYGVSADVNAADYRYVKVDFKNALKAVIIDLGTTFDVPMTFGLNIMSVPADKTIELAENGVTAINELPADNYVIAE